MRAITILAFAAAAALASSNASAQTAKENFGYRAPSGMFGDGTFKTDMYRFLWEDHDRQVARRKGELNETGSVQGGSINPDQYARPGDTRMRRREAR